MPTFIDYLETNVDCHPVSGGSQLQLDECPFCGHSGHDSRIYVGIEKQLGFCHHCEKGFSGISFIIAREGCSVKKAYEILDIEDDFISSPKEEKVALSEIPFPETRPIALSEDAQAYLDFRGIDSTLIEHFQIQYAIKNLRIVFPNGEERLYKTKCRVVLPILDIDGKIVSWQARDITGTARNKYLFPPEFESAKYLYNSNSISSGCDYLIICEGIFDVFGWWRAGFKNVVATFGKKISDYQIELIKKLAPKNVFIAWDKDAIKSKYEFCEKYGYLFPSTRIIDLPGSKDSDECNVEELLQSFKNAYNYDWTKKILRLL